MTDVVIVTSTWPTEADAARAAEVAVAERLAACAQVTGPIRSVFRWEGKVDQATEWYCHFKTTAERYAALEARLRALHPYEVPEIVAVPLVAGSAPYLAWIREQVREG